MNDDVIDAVELVARAVNGADNEWANMPKTDEHEPWDTYVARVVLSVPAVAEVFARDAKVREIVKEWDTTPTHDTHHMGSFKAMDLAARLDSPLNQNATFTAAQVAAMLREAGE